MDSSINLGSTLLINEAIRLDELQRLGILDTAQEERFDRYTKLARRLFDMPIVLVSLVDSNRQWFKSRVGLAATETPRDISFCGHAILEEQPLIIEDASADKRFHDNPLVTTDPNIRFYAGCPVKGPDGHPLGTICLIDREPRVFSDSDIESLKDIGDMDEFKQINDNFGHHEGDRALQAFANLLLETFRDSDVVARLGGDEFCALLTGTTASNAEIGITRLTEATATFNREAMLGFPLLFSAGISVCNPDAELAEALRNADEQMYQVKLRNRGCKKPA